MDTPPQQLKDVGPFQVVPHGRVGSAATRFDAARAEWLKEKLVRGWIKPGCKLPQLKVVPSVILTPAQRNDGVAMLNAEHRKACKHQEG